MARAQIVVQTWSPSFGWGYKTGYPTECEGLALERAKTLGSAGVPVRVYRYTSDGPEVIYETPRPDVSN